MSQPASVGSSIANPMLTQLQQTIAKLDQQLPRPKQCHGCPEQPLTVQQFDNLIASW